MSHMSHVTGDSDRHATCGGSGESRDLHKKPFVYSGMVGRRANSAGNMFNQDNEAKFKGRGLGLGGIYQLIEAGGPFPRARDEKARVCD